MTYSVVVVVVVAIAIRPVVHDVIVDIVIVDIFISIFDLLCFNPRGGIRFKLKTDNNLILDCS